VRKLSCGLLTASTLVGFSWAITGLAVGQERYPEGAFEEYSDDSLNISVFAFRDLNRSGSYDVGDRPMSGILVDATGNRRTITRRSNMSGFTNFEMSASDAAKDITFAGDYEFRVAVPPGWHVTTGNELQRAVFELVPGAPADIVAVPPPLPVGLAPDLTISGRIDPSVSRIEATSPTKETQIIATDGSGHYSLNAFAGDWRLATAGEGIPQSHRQVEVTTAPVVVSLIGAEDVPHAAPVGIDLIIDFDDLQSGGVSKIPSGYGGLMWDNFVMAYMKFYGSEGYRNNIISGEFVAYNGSGHPASISRDVPFDFVGGYLGASNFRAEGETLLIRAWRGEVLAYEETLVLSALGPLYFSANFQAVTRIDFATRHYWQVTFDDLTFRLPS
jgi:hypothetical protein